MSDKSCVSRDKCVESLRIIYLRLMQLNFSYQWVNALLLHPFMEQKYPDMCFCLQWTFATDAYITIDGMFSNGTYSFVYLSACDERVKERVVAAKERLEVLIPDFHGVRNQMFAHFIRKRDGAVVNTLFSKFFDVHGLISCLHKYCCDVLNVSGDEFGGYGSDVFHKMDEQIGDFVDMLLKGYCHGEDDDLCDRLTAIISSGGDVV